MRDDRWMLYGAYGFTGVLVAEEAVRRGHRPVLAGRSEDKLRPIAERLNLEMMALDLEDAAALEKALSGVALVFHAAGPFVHTSEPMLRACLATKTSYVDITGELSVLERTLSHDGRAKELGITLISGVGFDVIPTDCLARYVADAVPGATELEIAISAGARPSSGTVKSMLEMVPEGNFARRGGALVELPSWTEARTVRFPSGERMVTAIPWGDLVTAHRTTGIPNITTYLAMPPSQIRAMRFIDPVLRRAMAFAPIRKAAQKLVERSVAGPSEAERETGRSYVWARAADPSGASREAWLDTLEGYRFTAVGGVRSVEKILEHRPAGALTPALAFGADFVLEIEDTRRLDALD